MTYDNTNPDVLVDDKKVNKIIKRIMIEEIKNMKSQEKNDQEMVKRIKKLIEEEVQCY